MNIFKKVTLKNLKKNRTRTLVTIIGIIISAAMITSVTTFVSSLQKYLIESIKLTNGDWHVEFPNCDDRLVKKVSADDKTESKALNQHIGYAYLDGSINKYKPYLYVNGFSDEMFDTLPLKMIEGRLPENDSELLISKHIEANGGVNIKVGDTLTLALGTRELNGEQLYQSRSFVKDDPEGTESFVKSGITKAYKIVGVCERPKFESFSAPGYSVITRIKPENADKNAIWDMYIKLYKPSETEKFADKYSGEGERKFNTDLLYALGASINQKFNTVIYALSGILTAIIMTGSVLLIYNAFAISVSERKKELGILASVGANSKQLKRSVLFEGAVVGVFGIPLGIIAGIAGIGITLHYISDYLSAMMPGEAEMKLSVSAVSIIAALIIGAVTIIISAYRPAGKAAKISAIDAIRQTQDIKINAKSVKTSKFASKLFKLEGIIAQKNFKRNRKRYRSTVISLFVSIILFVSASSFAANLQKGSESVINAPKYDLRYDANELDIDKHLELLNTLSKVTGIKKAAFVSAVIGNGVRVSDEILTDRYNDFMNKITDNEDESINYKDLNLATVFIDDAAFTQYIKQQGENPKEYLRKDNPKIIAFAKEYLPVNETGRYENMDIFKKKNDIELTELNYDAEGNVKLSDKTITISAMVDELPFCVDRMGMLIRILPLSLVSEFGYGNEIEGSLVFVSNNVNASMDEMQKVIDSTQGIPKDGLINENERNESTKSMILVIKVFSYGFISLISLITIANVFNTISTNIIIRRKEFAMLRSVGMTDKSFNKMMIYECLIYGLRGLITGLPVSAIISYLIYRAVNIGTDVKFTLPYTSMAISAVCVFLVVSVTMVYSIRKIKKENTIDALKSDIM